MKPIVERIARATRRAALTALALAALLAAPTPARAAGLLIADGGLGGVLEIQEQTVNVTINNGVAVTEVEQIFHNTEQRQVEALYTFPVPKGASVSNFSMWINGKEMIGEVLEKKKAREIYDSYKTQKRDPGLLEQVDYKTFEMRIFPIAAGADQRVRLTYYQELDFDDDWATYVYPLATVTRKGIDSRAKGRFALTLNVKSESPIAEIASPSHARDFVIARRADDVAQASLETPGGDLNRDVVIACRTARPRTGIDVVASRRAENEDGYFCLTLTAGQELAGENNQNKGMDYVFVVDISGSMAEDGKLDLSRASVEAFIKSLGEGDRFEILAFNVSPNLLFQKLEPANAQTLERGAAFLRSQQAAGGTVLRPALETAWRYAETTRPLNVVILSDGMTEQGERAELLRLVGARPAGVKLFCVGVGNEVNRPLLSQMAEDAGGLAAFVSQGDDFERQAKAFRRKLTRPVAENIALDFAGGNVYDLEPVKLPNLYHGSPVRVYGRYRQAGPVTVTLKGDVMGQPVKIPVEIKLPAGDDENPEIERMWALKRVDRLLAEADRTGARDNVIQEVVRLGEGYSIATEYTSFLVLENDEEYKRWQIERRNVLRVERDRRKQDRLRAEFEKLNEKALASLGPVPTALGPAPEAVKDGVPEVLYEANPNAPAPQPATSQPALPSSAPRTSGQNIDLPSFGGGGAFDPVSGSLALGLGAMAWLNRRKKNGKAKEVKG